MIETTVTIDKGRLAKLQDELHGIANGIPRARHHAIRRTTDTARSRMVKAVAGDLNVKQKDLYQRGNNRRPIQVRFNRDGTMIAASRVDVTGKRIALIDFRARQTKKGVKYKIGRGTEAKHVDGAFVATMKSGHEGAFVRTSDKRLPIVELMGPSVPHVAQQRPQVRSLLATDAAALYMKNFEHQVQYLLEKGRAARA